jgi:hypothetical protein
LEDTLPSSRTPVPTGDTPVRDLQKCSNCKNKGGPRKQYQRKKRLAENRPEKGTLFKVRSRLPSDSSSRKKDLSLRFFSLSDRFNPAIQRWGADSPFLPADELQHLEAAQAHSIQLPFRATLCLPPTRRSPFDHFWQHNHPPQVNPYEYSARRLGISEEQLKEHFNDDIDSLLKEIEVVRSSFD